MVDEESAGARPRRDTGQATDPFARIMGVSAAAGTIRDFGRRAAAVDAPVLITGESGTGKGVLARAIHEASARARQALVAVNCAAIPETLFESEFFGHARGAFTGALQAHRGLFEQAHGGTLFLDEVGDLPPGMQAKLLTSIEDRVIRRVGAERAVQIDVRLLAATAAPLEDGVASGRFRRDLYYRLRVLCFHLPPLRERRADIPVLLQHLIRDYAARYGRAITAIRQDALVRLCEHDWPGNLRELANTVHAAVLACDHHVLGLEHVESSLAPAPAAAPGVLQRLPRTKLDADRIEAAIRRFNGNKTRAAASLGVTRATLRRHLRALSANDRTTTGQ